MGWCTDYPYAGINLMIRVSELTKTPISRRCSGDPNYWVVRLTDERCFGVRSRWPPTWEPRGFPEEVAPAARLPLEGRLPLGRRLLGHGRLAAVVGRNPAGCCRNSRSWTSRRTIRCTRFFDVAAVPQVTSINFWRGSGGIDLRARAPTARHANFRMIADEHGRIMVLMTHNTDIGDSWEREGEDSRVLLQFSPPATRSG